MKTKKVIKIYLISASEHDWFYAYMGHELMVVEDGENYQLTSLQAKLIGYKPEEVLLIPKIYADLVTTKPFQKHTKPYSVTHFHQK